MNRYLNQKILLGLLLSIALILSACSDNVTPSQIQPNTTTTSNGAVLPTNNATNTTVTTILATVAATIAITATTEGPTIAPTIPLTKAITDTVTAPALEGSEVALKATGFDGDEAKQLLDELTHQIGSRVIGTDGANKTAEWLESHYKVYGYNDVQRQEFPFATPELRQGFIFTGDTLTHDTVKSSGILLSKPKVTQFQANIVMYAPGSEVKGDIVVIASGGEYATLRPQVDTLVQAGAVAVLIPRLGLQPDYKTFADIEIPVIVVPFQTMPNLQPSSDKVSLKTSYVAGRQGNGQNIIATRAISTTVAPLLIFGGHYDSVANTSAANSNGSGTVVTLELAKVLYQKFPNYELRFVNFSGAETGLTGSLYYVSKLSDGDKKRLAAYINLDFVGVGDKFIATGTKDLVDSAVMVAQQNNIDLQAFDLNPTGIGSDYFAFANANLKTLSLDRWQDPLYRKPGDTPDRVFSQALLLAGGTAILVAQKIVGS